MTRPQEPFASLRVTPEILLAADIYLDRMIKKVYEEKEKSKSEKRK